ncbi:DUF3445 domain-containing protein [Mesorhizobium sp. Z1-4]|uniref:heme-dependent oxidative N-demethylase family protein n=1 Tax=Mesorhizobium sp. Z1-4 TaxID=2448478 RepID=UPI000FD7B267|nr:DUF3445 domain-containing protein [Mesorhizobium sp. Z1-4]
MAGPTHTPYDGSAKPFSIGLKPLDPAEWIEIDRHYRAQLEEKDRLIAERPDDVFAARPDTDAAQREVLEMVVDHLIRGHARIFPGRDEWDFLGDRLPRFQLHGSDEPPLQIAARFVQEDLVLMRRMEDGWRLAAASLCFPSSWTLGEKFDRPLEQIHKPVPGFGPDTRMATVIRRIFDNLQPEKPVERYNWSLQENDELYRPRSEAQKDARPGSSTGPRRDMATTFIRVERQTLRKLPVSGDILFTIRICLDPLAVLAHHPDRMRIAGSFAEQLDGLDTHQLAYKNLAADRDALAARLKALADG